MSDLTGAEDGEDGGRVWRVLGTSVLGAGCWHCVNRRVSYILACLTVARRVDPALGNTHLQLRRSGRAFDRASLRCLGRSSILTSVLSLHSHCCR